MIQPSSDVAARKAALALIDGVLRKHRSVDDAFDAATTRLAPRDRAFVRLLVATTLRRFGQIDAVLKEFVTRKPADPVMDILRLGAAQLLFLGTPPHAAVATSVALAKQGYAPASGFVNAVLRRVAEKGAALVAAQDAARLNTPASLWTSWENAYGAAPAREIAAAHLQEPPLDLSLKDEKAAAQWAADLKAEVLPTGALRLTQGGRVQDLKGFTEGAWWVQDAAAALPAKILMYALGSGVHTVIDLCAAPGGKTAQLASAGHRVTAVDVAPARLALLKENLARLKLSVEVIEADALSWRPSTPADALLLDAPCSATGTLRRHPDLPFLKTTLNLDAFAAAQAKLLTAAAEMVRPGGLVVYSVCSLQAEERAAVVDAVAAAAKLDRVPIPAAAVGGVAAFIDARGALATLPAHWRESGGLDGFYGCLLRKSL
ncbi:MAG: RsmB/NOP family class I SAM-dependent RNA methyltransferase [Rhodospirillaceae bacterium]